MKDFVVAFVILVAIVVEEGFNTRLGGGVAEEVVGDRVSRKRDVHGPCGIFRQLQLGIGGGRTEHIDLALVERATVWGS